jgi:hypothetical protein
VVMLLLLALVLDCAEHAMLWGAVTRR